MTLAWLSFLVSALAALTSFLAIPAFQGPLERATPRVFRFMQQRSVWIVAVSTSISAIFLLVYLTLLYPCPWYKIDNLKLDAVRLFQQNQLSAASVVGEELCACGELDTGWDIQAKAEYATREFRTAINFWHRSIRAEPDHAGEKQANIADASIWLNDFKGATDGYRALYAQVPSSGRYRYGLGRALVFSGAYQEAADLLRGLNVPDGGSLGQAQIFEGISYIGMSMTVGEASQKEALIAQAKQQICAGIRQEPQWRAWLFEPHSQVGHLDYLRAKLFATPIDIGC